MYTPKPSMRCIKKFGFNKFIIAVPSLPIKAGISQFIDDSYVKHHFSDACGYNCDIELGVIESPKKQKKGFFGYATCCP